MSQQFGLRSFLIDIVALCIAAVSNLDKNSTEKLLLDHQSAVDLYAFMENLMESWCKKAQNAPSRTILCLSCIFQITFINDEFTYVERNGMVFLLVSILRENRS